MISLPCTWLTQGKTAHLLPRGERSDPLSLLLLRAELQDGSDVEGLKRQTRQAASPHRSHNICISAARPGAASAPTGCAHVVDRHHHPRAGAAPADLLHGQAVRQVVHPSSAQLLWNLHRHHTHRPQLLDLKGSKMNMSCFFLQRTVPILRNIFLCYMVVVGFS